MSERVHIFGASGSGTTSLAKAVANARGLRHIDTDDIYWLPTQPPFTAPRERSLRQAILRRALEQQDQWVLSGSLCGWGDFVTHMFDLAVFLWVPNATRIERLRLREIQRYGERIEDPSDPRHEAHRQFLEWAGNYDSGGEEIRSKALHEQWMKTLPCPLIRIEGTQPLNEYLQIILNALHTVPEQTHNTS